VRSLGRLAPATSAEEDEAEPIREQLLELDGELARYAEAVAKVGPAESLLREITLREERRASLRADRATSPRPGGTVVRFDRAKLQAEIRVNLGQWRAILRRNPHEARALLTALLGGKRLRFEPTSNAAGRRHPFSGEAALSGFSRSEERFD